MTDLAEMALVSAVVLAALQGCAALWGRLAGRWMVADVVWGLGLAAVALLGLATGSGGGVRRWVLVLVVGVWGGRLASHVWGRLRTQDHDDPRYERMAAGRSRIATALRVFGMQGVIQWVVSLPIQVSAVSGDPHGLRWAVAIFGSLVAVGGIALETVADRQLERYKRQDPRPVVMDQGLWAWSRHPNYFGDACVWTGVYLVACSTWPGVLTIISPVVMTALLIWGSGVRLTERAMADRPGYAAYQARTSAFVPRPPRRG
ncbi:DUF1295 domain-containing protein [Flexivirga caeni]|uniref:DUF1295 domain-containing protein n=1 Tax=Flexivirga caeni TaxID=2294115 RepID=A0A3M9M1R8_9MICO|nr:DUF1295 domain-containing protein [Flexivirga caeni]RNI19511.1 DUF1295 domain-containing protein [Flexivirga caeni]